MERFWSKVRKKEGCWEWLACKNAYGYGKFAFNGSWRLAHRVALELAGERVSYGMEVCHSCDNPACVNPSHLFIATHAENMADMAAKGRASRQAGQRNPKSILTEDQVRKIRSSNATPKDLAEHYGVTRTAIYDARNGKTWGHVV